MKVLDQDFHSVKCHLDAAIEVALGKDVFVKLKLFKKVIVGVLRIVVGDDPVADLCILAHEYRIGNRGVAPANAPLVLEWCILRFMDE